MRVINDERANLPDISDTDPHDFILVAAAMEVDAEVKQERSSFASRLKIRRLRDMLEMAVTVYEERARVPSWQKEMDTAAKNPRSSNCVRERRQPSELIVVRILFFGAARDAWARRYHAFVKRTATAAAAFAQVIEKFPALQRFGRSLLFAINEEYAAPDRDIRAGDELAVFPPVSGGSVGALHTSDEVEITSHDFFELTTEPIDVGAVARRVVLPECGATVTLDGYAREWTKGRRTLHLVYEAYTPMALSEMQRLGRAAHGRFEFAYIGIVHRTGKLEIGETSVVIAVGAPHRRTAFAACEWAIQELKRTVRFEKRDFRGWRGLGRRRGT